MLRQGHIHCERKHRSLSIDEARLPRTEGHISEVEGSRLLEGRMLQGGNRRVGSWAKGLRKLAIDEPLESVPLLSVHDFNDIL